jgi:hypothetical protein
MEELVLPLLSPRWNLFLKMNDRNEKRVVCGYQQQARGRRRMTGEGGMNMI